MANVFGFSTEPTTGGDWLPIIKYDARSGRMFRIDRVQGSDGSFVSDPVDITQTFKAVFDFDNIESGWIDFPVGSAPSFYLVPIGQQLPPKPSEKHKNGVRILLKLAPSCGGDKQVREIASSAKAFLGGIEQVYSEYLREKAKYPGQLPVITLASTTPVVTGTGQTKSTNYRPTFHISGWAKRPVDLVHTATQTPSAPAAHTNGAGNGSAAAPSTGSQTVPPPNSFRAGNTAAPTVATMADDDFG